MTLTQTRRSLMFASLLMAGAAGQSIDQVTISQAVATAERNYPSVRVSAEQVAAAGAGRRRAHAVRSSGYDGGRVPDGDRGRADGEGGAGGRGSRESFGAKCRRAGAGGAAPRSRSFAGTGGEGDRRDATGASG